uniref:Maturase K n=1 Tax=Hemionitis ludens TaxID=377232 RepID=A0A3G5CSW6_HEMLU|nr:maturase K [Calciphilopteris ludens]AYW15967.1 maturase K [Calciphilopteris ludens]
MEAIYEYFAKFGALQKNKELIIKENCFLHPSLLLFEENSYLMDSKRRSHGPDIELVFGAWSVVAVKRLIDKIRGHNYLKVANLGFVRNQANELDADLYFHPLIKIIYLILGISLLSRVESRTSSSLKTSQSIHSIFFFLEDRFPKSNHVLQTDLPRNVHLETIIRLFRRQIKDVSFPHLLRIVFYEDKFFCGKTTHSRKGKQKGDIDTPLQNFYISEIDSLPLTPWKRVCKSRVNYFLSIDRCNITRKERHVSAYEFESDTASVDSYFTRRSCIHYGRCSNKFLIAFEGTRYFVTKWFYYFSTFSKHNFHYQTKFNEPCPKLLSTSCASFPGYTLTAQSVSYNVRIGTAESLYISILERKKFHPKIPNSTLTKILAKHRFCDISGRPVGKSAWATSRDNEIMNGYVRFWQVFFLYYGASMSHDKLRRLRYILQISCDSTLAGKHKGTIRLLRRRFNLETLNQIPVFSKSKPSNNRRVWSSTSIRFLSVESASLDMGLQ